MKNIKILTLALLWLILGGAIQRIVYRDRINNLHEAYYDLNLNLNGIIKASKSVSRIIMDNEKYPMTADGIEKAISVLPNNRGEIVFMAGQWEIKRTINIPTREYPTIYNGGGNSAFQNTNCRSECHDEAMFHINWGNK